MCNQVSSVYRYSRKYSCSGFGPFESSRGYAWFLCWDGIRPMIKINACTVHILLLRLARLTSTGTELKQRALRDTCGTFCFVRAWYLSKAAVINISTMDQMITSTRKRTLTVKSLLNTTQPCSSPQLCRAVQRFFFFSLVHSRCIVSSHSRWLVFNKNAAVRLLCTTCRATNGRLTKLATSYIT